jgi:hypothetical protein
MYRARSTDSTVGNGVVGRSVQPAKPAKNTATAILQIHVNVVIASIPNAKVAAKARQRRCLWTLFSCGLNKHLSKHSPAIQGYPAKILTQRII